MDQKWTIQDELNYRKAHEHFKKNPYLKDIMEAIEDLEKRAKEA